MSLRGLGWWIAVICFFERFKRARRYRRLKDVGIHIHMYLRYFATISPAVADPAVSRRRRELLAILCLHYAALVIGTFVTLYLVDGLLG